MPIHAVCFSEARDILLVSATESLAVEWLSHIRRHFEENSHIHHFFGKFQSDKWTQNELITTNGITIRAKGMGAQIRGFHPDLVIVDDMETEESVGTEEQRQKVKEWFNRVLMNALTLEGRSLSLI